MRSSRLTGVITAVLVVIIGCSSAPEASPSPGLSPSPAVSPSPGASAPALAGASASPAQIALPQPILTFLGHRRLKGRPPSEAYDLAIANWQDYPAELFMASPELTACVHIRDGSTTAELASLCSLGAPAQLAELSFAIAHDQPVPTAVYVEVVDPQTDRIARSLSVPIIGTAGPPLTPLPPVRPSPAVTPSPTPSTPAVAEGWIGPERIFSRGYGNLSLVLGADGVAHAAAGLGGGIFYLTNASGSWTRERLTTGLRTRREIIEDGQPSIAIDGDGSISIAFVRRSGSRQDVFGPHPEAIYLVTNRGGSWSQPAALVGEGLEHSPSLQVRQGNIHLAYQVGYAVDVLSLRSRFPIRYTTNAGGIWTDERVAGHGTAPILRLAPDGTARVLFGDEYGLLRATTELRYATATTPTGSFAVEPVSGSSDEDAFYRLELDNAGRPNVLWVADESDDGPVIHVQRHDGSWSHSEITLAGADLPARPGLIEMETDSQGAIHLLLNTAEYVPVGDDWEYRTYGVFYATNRTAELRFDRLPPESASHGALTIDQQGHPHLLFGTAQWADGEKELWYGVGPGY
jgi:hypothetical protein